MKKRFIVETLWTLFILSAILPSVGLAQMHDSPRLVVVVVLDQFPHEYLTRFQKYFGPSGFRYLLDGAVFTNATYKHANTSTGPGHAVILSGAYGRTNGIVNNSWYDRAERRNVYCVEDRTVQPLGSGGEGRSPANFIGLTYGDMVRINTAFRAKVVTVSNKDRAAILLGGKYANLALWMRDSVFVSSTYYAKELPAWVRKFNASGKIASYFGSVWEKSLPPAGYQEVDRDDAPYEDGGNGLGVSFPHPIRGNDAGRITRSYYAALQSSPYGAEVLAELARQAVVEEKLGKRGVMDVLGVSFSSTDFVGHAFGPHSQEMLDMTVRMDRILASFFGFLDRQVGLNRCLIVLTSDHGVSPSTRYLNEHSSVPVVREYTPKSIVAAVESLLSVRFPQIRKEKWIENFSGGSLFFRTEAPAAASISVEDAGRAVCDAMLLRPEVSAAFTRGQIRLLSPTSLLERRVQNSFFEIRSGDVVIAPRPLWVSEGDGLGASHGSPVEWDAHVPLLIRGVGVRGGWFYGEASPADIAPTLSALTGVEFPPSMEGRVLVEAIDSRGRGRAGR